MLICKFRSVLSKLYELRQRAGRENGESTFQTITTKMSLATGEILQNYTSFSLTFLHYFSTKHFHYVLKNNKLYLAVMRGLHKCSINQRLNLKYYSRSISLLKEKIVKDISMFQKHCKRICV